MGSGSSSAYQLTKEEEAALKKGYQQAPGLKKKVDELKAGADKSKKLEEEVTTLQKEKKELQAVADKSKEEAGTMVSFLSVRINCITRALLVGESGEIFNRLRRVPPATMERA
eukprot:s3010_g3.t1